MHRLLVDSAIEATRAPERRARLICASLPFRRSVNVCREETGSVVAVSLQTALRLRTFLALPPSAA
jgi:hypothetical protein